MKSKKNAWLAIFCSFLQFSNYFKREYEYLLTQNFKIYFITSSVFIISLAPVSPHKLEWEQFFSPLSYTLNIIAIGRNKVTKG